MEFFLLILVMGIIIVVTNRIKTLEREQATIHCIQHKWILNERREMYCENCKQRPE